MSSKHIQHYLSDNNLLKLSQTAASKLNVQLICVWYLKPMNTTNHASCEKKIKPKTRWVNKII
jgi:hypothetical protein